MAAARARAEAQGTTVAHVLRQALGEAFDVEHQTLFQVSTSGAIVEGLYEGCVSVAELQAHGDFGLGTFDGLDGELVMLDGRCFRARGDGAVSLAGPTDLTPFAVVTRFHADRTEAVDDVLSLSALESRLDGFRSGDNLFVGLRAHGTFESLHLRAACRSESSVPLVEATEHQREWTVHRVTGTLVGFWSPAYSRSVAVTGYHLHFLSDDHSQAGHVLDLSGSRLEVAFHDVHDLHLALPESAEFLRADLSRDPTVALDVAEHGSGRGAAR